MNYTCEPVSALSIAGMITSGVLAVIAPVVFSVIWRKKTGAKVSSLIMGCVTFFVFAIVLEGFFHNIVLGYAGEALTAKPLLYSIYGGLAAGVFEEFGRRFAMKAGMKGNLKTLNKENAVMYGIGHGGIEAVLICGISEISNVASAISINQGRMNEILSGVADAAQRDSLYQQISGLWTLSPDLFFAAGIERISAITFHICASYLVYKAVSDRKAGPFLLAILLHAVMDSATMFLNLNGCSIWIIEAVAAAFSAGLAVYTVKDYRKRKDAAEA